MALSFQQLCEHFDVKQASALRRLLKARGIRWINDRNGKPTTTEAELDRALSAKTTTIRFTKPPCKKKGFPSRQGSASGTERGTSSARAARPQSYAE
jgi:hypothetical protein